MKKGILFAIMLVLCLVSSFVVVTKADDYNYYQKVAAFLANPEFADGTHWSNAYSGDDVQHPKTYTVNASGCNAYVRDFVHECWKGNPTDPYPSEPRKFYYAAEITDGDIIYIDSDDYKSPHWYAVVQRLDDDNLRTAEASGNEVRVRDGKYTVSNPGNSTQFFRFGYHMPDYVEYTGEPRSPQVSVEVDAFYADVYWSNVWASSYSVRIELADNGQKIWEGDLDRACLHYRFCLGEALLRVIVTANFPGNETRSGEAYFRCVQAEVPKVSVQTDGPYADITWSNQQQSKYRTYMLAVADAETNAQVWVGDMGKETFAHLYIGTGSYRAFVTAVYPDEEVNQVGNVDFTLTEPEAPEVEVETDGYYAELAWSNQSPSKYRTYTLAVVDTETNTQVWLGDMGKQTSIYLYFGSGSYRAFVSAAYPGDTSYKVGTVDFTLTEPETPVVEAKTDGPYVDLTWSNQLPSKYRTYYLAVVDAETNAQVWVGDMGKETFAHLLIGPGTYRAFVTAVYSVEAANRVGTVDFTLEDMDAPVVSARTDGQYVNLSWSNQSTSDYRTYFVAIVVRETNELVWSGSVDTQTQARILVGEGDFRAFVTAVYPETEVNSTGTADFVCTNWETSVNGGDRSVHIVGEEIQLSANFQTYDSCNLSIYSYPIDGDQVLYDQASLYWSGSLDSAQYSMRFWDTGFYACTFTATNGVDTLGSQFVSWYINPLEAQTASGYLASYEPGQSVTIGLNTNAFSQANLQIFRTPPGGEVGTDKDSYLYFEGTVNPTSYTVSFEQEGFYSCNFIVPKDGGSSFGSEWTAWYVTSKTHITYNLNGGTGEIGDQMKLFNTPLTLSEAIPVREGYAFRGWATSADNIEKLYRSGAAFDKEGSFTIYAIWGGDDPDFFLPDSLTVIESDAFSGIKAKGVVIPESVVSIEGNPFFGSSVTTIYGFPNSIAQELADQAGYTFFPIDDAWLSGY